jgi:two-component system chemotaxis response regulator CheY
MKRVLIAEDEKDVRTVFRRMLGGRYEVIEAINGQEAVEKYKAHKPDLALIDIRMPVMTGDRAIREIQKHDPGAKIIAVTAYGYSKEELGVEVLRKGFGVKEFLRIIGRKLGEGT